MLHIGNTYLTNHKFCFLMPYCHIFEPMRHKKDSIYALFSLFLKRYKNLKLVLTERTPLQELNIFFGWILHEKTLENQKLFRPRKP